MTNDELDQYIEREYKADHPVAAGALLLLRCLDLPDVITKNQGDVMQESFSSGAYYVLALLRGAAGMAGAQPLPPVFAELLEQLYREAQGRSVMVHLDIEAQIVEASTGAKH